MGYWVMMNAQEVGTQFVAGGSKLRGATHYDKAGTQSDALAIVLAAEGSIALPPAGVALSVSLGFGGALKPKGRFVVGGIGESGWPRKIMINASAASLNSDRGEAVMQSQKTRAWDDVSLPDIVQKIAAEHGLKPKGRGNKSLSN